MFRFNQGITRSKITLSCISAYFKAVAQLKQCKSRSSDFSLHHSHLFLPGEDERDFEAQQQALKQRWYHTCMASIHRFFTLKCFSAHTWAHQMNFGEINSKRLTHTHIITSRTTVLSFHRGALHLTLLQSIKKQASVWAAVTNPYFGASSSHASHLFPPFIRGLSHSAFHVKGFSQALENGLLENSREK